MYVDDCWHLAMPVLRKEVEELNRWTTQQAWGVPMTIKAMNAKKKYIHVDIYYLDTSTWYVHEIHEINYIYI